MKALIICDSEHHGNTDKVAKAMAEVLEAKVVRADGFEPNDIIPYDLVGFGSGIYFSKHADVLFNVVNSFPKQEGKKAFVFSTSGSPRIPILNEFERPLMGKLVAKGFKVLGSFWCLGYDTYNPDGLDGRNSGKPSFTDLERAKAFAKTVKDKF